MTRMVDIYWCIFKANFIWLLSSNISQLETLKLLVLLLNPLFTVYLYAFINSLPVKTILEYYNIKQLYILPSKYSELFQKNRFSQSQIVVLCLYNIQSENLFFLKDVYFMCDQKLFRKK